MAMSTSSAAALTRTAQRELKELASDAISIPTTEELYARKSAELSEARRKLAEIVARQIKLESGNSTNFQAHQSIVAEKAAAEALVARLENEGGLLKAELIAQRPKPPLTPQQQLLIDSFPVVPPSPYSKDEMRAAQAEVDRVVHEKRLARFNGDHRAEEGLAPAYKEAKLKLDVMSGGYAGHWPPSMPYATREDMAAAMKKWGRK
jgi:hypothetical protein